MQCLTIVPIIWVLSAAVPVPGGLGVMEYLFIPFFAMAIAPPWGNRRSYGDSEGDSGCAGDRPSIGEPRADLCLLDTWRITAHLGGHLPKAEEME